MEDSGPQAAEFIRLEAQLESLLNRIDRRAAEMEQRGGGGNNPRLVREAQDWRVGERTALQEWRITESLITDEWRSREALVMEEWQYRQEALCFELRERHDLSLRKQVDTRDLLQTEIDSLEQHCEGVFNRIRDRAEVIRHTLVPPKQTPVVGDLGAVAVRPASKRLELWNEIRRLEEKARQQQVQQMLQKGPLILELEARDQKEREEREYSEFVERTEREKREMRKLEETEAARRKSEFSAQMLDYLVTVRGPDDNGMFGAAGSEEAVLRAANRPLHTPAYLMGSSFFKSRASLELRIALLGAFRYLNEFELQTVVACICREWRQMLFDDRLVAQRRQDVMQLLEGIGIAFVRIPAGLYAIGKPADVQPAVICYQGYNTHLAEYFTLEQEFTLTHDVYLSANVITVSMWREVVRIFPHLEKLVTDTDMLLASSCNIACPTSATSSLVPQVVAKDVPEDDPALELPYHVCARIVTGLCATLPTWQEWEVAVRGPDSYYYPWGNAFDPVRAELEGVVHGWCEPNPRFGQVRNGAKDLAAEVHCSLTLNRVKDFGKYAGAESPFGLKDTLRWGKEWNVARRDCQCYLPEERITTQCLRSLTDLYSVNDVHAWDTAFEEELLRSNHRSFSAPMAFCLRAPRPMLLPAQYRTSSAGSSLTATILPRAAFRLAFAADGAPQVHAGRPTNKHWM